MTFYYEISEFDTDKNMTFRFNGDSSKKHTFHLQSTFPDYRPVPIDYYIDLNNGDIVYIKDGSKSMSSLRGPTKGWINQEGDHLKPLTQFYMDADEVKNNRANDNHRVYTYLENKYKELYQ